MSKFIVWSNVRTDEEPPLVQPRLLDVPQSFPAMSAVEEEARAIVDELIEDGGIELGDGVYYMDIVDSVMQSLCKEKQA